MQEFEQKILEQYDIEVNSTRKVRGAVLCETNKGVFLLKEVTTSEKRIPALCELYTWLYEQGEHQIDYMVANRNGEYISSLDNGDRYMLKKWYVSRDARRHRAPGVFLLRRHRRIRREQAHRPRVAVFPRHRDQRAGFHRQRRQGPRALTHRPPPFRLARTHCP